MAEAKVAILAYKEAAAAISDLRKEAESVLLDMVKKYNLFTRMNGLFESDRFRFFSKFSGSHLSLDEENITDEGVYIQLGWDEWIIKWDLIENFDSILADEFKTYVTEREAAENAVRELKWDALKAEILGVEVELAE